MYPCALDECSLSIGSRRVELLAMVDVGVDFNPTTCRRLTSPLPVSAELEHGTEILCLLQFTTIKLSNGPYNCHFSRFYAHLERFNNNLSSHVRPAMVINVTLAYNEEGAHGLLIYSRYDMSTLLLALT